MNKNCEKTFCPYHKTCLMQDPERIKKCTGILSKKNPQHPEYAMQVRSGE